MRENFFLLQVFYDYNRDDEANLKNHWYRIIDYFTRSLIARFHEELGGFFIK